MSSSPSESAEPSHPTRDEFAQRIMDGIRQAGETRELIYDTGQYLLQPAGEKWPLMNLSNVYREFCLASDEHRSGIVKNVVRNWFADRRQIPERYQDLHPDLLPTVRSRCSYELTSLQFQLEGAQQGSWTYQILADHLAVGLVYDLPDMMRLIVQDDLDEWGMTFYVALEDARDNLANMGAQSFISPADGVFISATGDNYDATRMLLLEMIGQMEVQGDHVACLPNRDTLIVTGSENDEGLAILAALVKESLNHPRPISGMAFRLQGDQWQPWLPPAEHSQYQAFKMLKLMTLGQEYGEQKELLDKLHEKQGSGIYVASYSAMQNESTGEVNSYSVWSAGVDTLLPSTDLVYFFRPHGNGKQGDVVAVADWQRMQQVAGNLVEEVDIYPPRIRVRDFPNDEQLAELVPS